eukprot:Hpha_TRINITY_DN7436_c0_g2::TRINITY_DN7436_c0_g2_i1::g.95950::m.95950
MQGGGPFLYLRHGGGEAFAEIGSQSNGEVSVRVAPGVPSIQCDGAFEEGASAEEVFGVALKPLCERAMGRSNQGGQGVCCMFVSKTPCLFDEAVSESCPGVLAVSNILEALSAANIQPGSLRLSLCCFLANAERWTDLFKNVHQQVPPGMAWDHPTFGCNAVYCSSPGSARRTISAVLGDENLRPLLPRLSFVMTLIVKGRAPGRGPAVLTVLDLRPTPAQELVVPRCAAAWRRGGDMDHQADLLSHALHATKPYDFVGVWECRTDDGSSAAAARGVFAGLRLAGARTQRQASPPPSPTTP